MTESESPFNVNELFFSRTDARGIILGGNSVFVRVSEFSTEELINKPHNIIRHPEMPKAVFKLLWSYLLTGKSIVAYVKNRSKSGKYYWVLAYATPISNGFLSIRLKPTSKLFNLIPILYREMLTLESRPQGVNQATEFLLSQLKTLGLESYDDFMSLAVTEEMNSRDHLLVPDRLDHSHHGEEIQNANRLLTLFKSVVTSASHLSEVIQQFRSEAVSVIDRCSQLGHLAINMAAGSERLGAQGVTLNVVSSKFNEWGQSVRDSAVKFEHPVQRILELSKQMRFTAATARYACEMYRMFLMETAKDSSSQTVQENKHILSMKAIQLATEGLKVGNQFGDLSRQVSRGLESLAVSLTALEIIRLTGKIETSRILEGQEKIGTHIQEMQALLNDVRGPMTKMIENIHSSESEMKNLVPSLSQISNLLSE